MLLIKICSKTSTCKVKKWSNVWKIQLCNLCVASRRFSSKLDQLIARHVATTKSHLKGLEICDKQNSDHAITEHASTNLFHFSFSPIQNEIRSTTKQIKFWNTRLDLERSIGEMKQPAWSATIYSSNLNVYWRPLEKMASVEMILKFALLDLVSFIHVYWSAICNYETIRHKYSSLTSYTAEVKLCSRSSASCISRATQCHVTSEDSPIKGEGSVSVSVCRCLDQPLVLETAGCDLESELDRLCNHYQILTAYELLGILAFSSYTAPVRLLFEADKMTVPTPLFLTYYAYYVTTIPLTRAQIQDGGCQSSHNAFAKFGRHFEDYFRAQRSGCYANVLFWEYSYNKQRCCDPEVIVSGSSCWTNDCW